MEFHEVANIFPILTGDEYASLRDDIKANGLIESIWTYQGKIIDGRNRYKVCTELGIEPRYREWEGTGSLVSFVVSLNLHRRHLSVGQRAALAVDLLPAYEAEAKERQGTRTDLNIPQIIAGSSGEAREQAAQATKTNRQYVSDAKKIKEEAPDLFADVKAGTKTIPGVKRELAARTKQDAPPLPSNKFRVFYADPPWHYTDKIDEAMPGTTTALTHYPSMSIKELCALNVKDMAEKDAVLFLWVTSPMLAECFQIIKAWGFEYKTSFVWDKVGHNFGHYNSVRHEFLLVCTRGSCTPDSKELTDSVQSIKKSKVHSEKPEEFRNIIDSMYTYGKRIELFARKKVEGWEYYGNELR